MDTGKRKRDSRVEDAHSRKLLHGKLQKRYQSRRQLSEILNKGRIDRGHFAGKLTAIEKDQETHTIVIVVKDDRGKRIRCSLPASKNLYQNLATGITKEIQIAMSNPTIAVIDIDSSLYYDHQLEYDHYQFILDHELFSTIPDGWRDSDSSDEEIPEQQPKPKEPPKQQASSSNYQPNQYITASSLNYRSDQSIPRTLAPNPKFPGKMPSDWTPISTARDYLGRRVEKIAGIVRRAEPERLTRNGDWSLELEIEDETCVQPLEVKLYASEKIHLPPEGIVGHAIIFSQMKILERKGAYLYAQGDKRVFRYTCYQNNSEFRDLAFVRQESGVNPPPERTYHPTSSDREGLQRLVRWSRGESRTTEQIPKANGRSTATHMLLKDIRNNQSITCTVEVLDVWNERDCSDVKVTDYTEHPQLSEPRDAVWSHPPGRRTFRIRLWDQPAQQARNLIIGEIYRIKNLRIKEAGESLFGNGGKARDGLESTSISTVYPSDTYYCDLKARKSQLEGRSIPREIVSSPNFIRISSPATKVMTPVTAPQPTTAEENQPAVGADRAEKIAIPTGEQKATLVKENTVGYARVPVLRDNYPEFPRFMGDVELANIRHTPQVPRMFYFQARIVDIIPSSVEEAVYSSCAKCGPIDRMLDTTSCSTCKRSDTILHNVRFYFILQDSERELPVEVFDEVANVFFCLPAKSNQNRSLLVSQVARRLHHLMGTTGGNDSLKVGGISDIFGFVGKVYMTLENDDPLNAQWLRRYALSGCRIRGPNAS